MVAESNSLYAQWLEQRLDHWQNLNRLVSGTRRDRTLEETREVLNGYRALASDLAMARRHIPGTTIHRALEALYRRTHNSLHQQPFKPLHELWLLFSVLVPEAARVLRADILVIVMLFIAATVASFVAVTTWPDVAGWFLSDHMMLMVQNRTLWTDDLLNVIPSSLLSYELMARTH